MPRPATTRTNPSSRFSRGDDEESAQLSELVEFLAYAALEASRRALTIAGVDGTRLACARTEDDLPHNVNPTNIATVSEVVTEVIRRS